MKTESRKQKAEIKQGVVRAPGFLLSAFCFPLWLFCFPLSVFASPAKPAAPAATANAASGEKLPIPQSVFLVPRSKGDGVDPFYPRSTRLELAAPTSSTNRTQVVGELVIKGISGTPAQPLVILNDRTFRVDDEQEVVTPQGRVRVRCIEIRLKDEAAIVEVNGERRELGFRRGK